MYNLTRPSIQRNQLISRRFDWKHLSVILERSLTCHDGGQTTNSDQFVAYLCLHLNQRLVPAGDYLHCKDMYKISAGKVVGEENVLCNYKGIPACCVRKLKDTWRIIDEDEAVEPASSPYTFNGY